MYIVVKKKTSRNACTCRGQGSVQMLSRQRLEKVVGGCHGRDCMVVGFTITYAISGYHH